MSNTLTLKTPLFSFGIIADVQYANVDDGYNYSRTKLRRYRNSVNLLADAIKNWNNMSPKPSFMFQLGDLIDGHNRRQGDSRKAWEKLTQLLSSFDGKVFHTYGNHEYYNFTHKEMAQLLPAMTLVGSKDPDNDPENIAQRLRYSFSPHEMFQFVILDSYEISMLGYDKEEPEYLKGKEIITAINKGPVGMIKFTSEIIFSSSSSFASLKLPYFPL